MSRNALAVFFERLVLASLPLAMPACKVQHDAPPVAGDLAVAIGGGGLDEGADLSDRSLVASDLGRGDLARNGDLGENDPCDTTTSTDPPPLTVPFPASAVPDGGFATTCQGASFCNQYCPSTRYTTCCGPHPADGGALTLDCILDCTGPGPGRRPAGLERAAISGDCEVGRWLAQAAHLEAASVHAFRRLGRELTAHGAPARLVTAARRALGDEVRHARLTRRLALAHGATPAPVRVAPSSPRTLEEIAIENATEGCVRETFAALLALWQARAAGDDELRAAMATVAPDELRHAALAWDVDAWARRSLDAAARRRLTRARLAAVDELAAELAAPPSPTLIERVGLPDAARARQLLDATRAGLWSRGRVVA